MVVWCAIFSTLHLHISVANYWVLCLCVSLVAIFLTAAIIFILSHGNKEVGDGWRGGALVPPVLLVPPVHLLPLFSRQLNVNIDVRLIQVNERLAKHKLLAAVADWVQNCSGNMQVNLSSLWISLSWLAH